MITFVRYLAAGWLTVGLLLAGEATWLPTLAFNTGPFLMGVFCILTMAILTLSATGAWHHERSPK